ncbi:hypothetical protein [Pseudobacteriovorax antillogorgiicola]|uniref:Uncharacterized protein n=1 Tax=Pseudobacteriovorax antillogorgiicola TaxID=1513793 RepID=A0A1Y6BWM7_9BACT|nr:hypothetical protein [Pseudobacteriovorax antillogorgiicola]TCS50250.1 hypothetical protein EDD56_11368 [Pseudobacteriovorax antillogorgiicola]SMF32926.1 hypothetical protein SAMN06296036_11067 [Pseudobacteriovorax antillogorgiicola]
MASPFENVTRVAIKEIITGKANESKFGFVMTHDDLHEICDDLFNLLLTSRNLKAAGDRFISSGALFGGSKKETLQS